LNNKIFYRDQDITLIVVLKAEHTSRVIAERKGIEFQAAYDLFIHSDVNRVLMNPESLLWTENAEYIADMYEKSDG